MKIQLLLVSFLMIVNTLGYASEAVEDPCGSSGARGVGECAKLKLKKADEELNKVYQGLLSQLPNDSEDNHPKKELIEAQRAWIKYRDELCDFEGEMGGGVRAWKSTYSVSCLATVTKAQVLLLKKYTYCLNGGGEACGNFHLVE